LLADVAANEAAAAEYRDELGVDHRTATSGSRRSLTRRPPTWATAFPHQ
jgi:hypothetical protein